MYYYFSFNLIFSRIVNEKMRTILWVTSYYEKFVQIHLSGAVQDLTIVAGRDDQK